ncbi:chemical-damaging agent resistance protein C [Flavobacterium branchiophilum NBRC 15030 = ATCC 35035]|uniref:TerZ/TerD family protein, possibly involved in tellurium resistance n=2 Tax=Flavobacterium branchiophilum TaxID=55197 RepID=G2Z397_FLABF|nr:TerD family protein [Flavobacterium branchiophilum]OXA76247.1 chemical-damaging agent resistance protein C [Flavobacterium branchiophilum NBRC 15030 = ATCC 35035]PDS27149.1 chemical-damaging agent resistance protein C [Flavobacterium branchiophilum]TQM40494.1 tellurium resistance protein TerD [Flavobacterium branchiophilum]CCB68210.1 TerZ/TerD family protein, possibly involved in tellurium resistance [Flavobacterium branchiophilum FL-15]GEM56282.1 chemical-damaging agent resistance protein 
MAINLQKGQRENINAPQFTIGLGWDTNQSSTGSGFDLDASVFVLGENKKMLSDDHFVFYNNLKTPDGAVEHTGDNLTGDGDGDDEQIKVNLSKIAANASEICIVVTIHDAEERKQNFGQVRNSFIRIFDTASNQEILKYELDEDFSIETAVEFGRIYKRNDEWKFEAVGMGMKGGLQDYLNKYN